MITDNILHKYLRHLNAVTDNGPYPHMDAVELAFRLAIEEIEESMAPADTVAQLGTANLRIMELQADLERLQTATDAEVAAALAYITRHSVAGLAPAVNWYEATCTANGCRSLAYLRKHTGLRYVDLVIRAGLTPRGGWARAEAARRDRPQRRIGVPDEVEDQVEQEAAHRLHGWQDRHGRTWLDGGSAGWFSPTLPVCMPRREEIGRQDRPDGTVIVTYRYYYPLK